MFKYISKKLKHIFSLIYNNLNLSNHLNLNQIKSKSMNTLRQLADKAIKSNQLIRNNNIETFLVTIKDLVKTNIIVPSEQRIIVPETISEIEEYQETFFKKHKHFNFIGTINVHFCEEHNKFYLMDGQHRYTTITKLYNKQYHDEKVAIELITVPTYQHVLENYKILNKNTPLPEWSPNIDENIPKQVFVSIRNQFPNIFTKNKNTKRPFINQNDFQEALGYLTEKLNEKHPASHHHITETDLKALVLNKNSQMQKWTVESYQQIRKGVKWENYKKIADKHQFYLGMHKTNGQEYHFDWVKEIIQQETGYSLPKIKNINPITKKKKIPKQLKIEVWNKYIGEEHGASFCYCCRKVKITSHTFQAGHFIAESKGGSTILTNLRPICAGCNQSMGTENMRTYIETYYPENLPLFQNNVSPGLYSTQHTPPSPQQSKPSFFNFKKLIGK